jgi:PAS domain-containing protein
MSMNSAESRSHAAARTAPLGAKKRKITESMASYRVEDVVDGESQSELIILMSANAPFHVEWVSREWSNTFGWSLEEILGLDCRFLHGGLTDLSTVNDFMRRLVTKGESAEMTVVYYCKDGSHVTSTVSSFPVIDQDCDDQTYVSHYMSVITVVQEESIPLDTISGRCASFEVGLMVDRREQCTAYANRETVPAPSIKEWQIITKELSLGLILRYSLRSKAAMIITDKAGRIVHVNTPWVKLTGLPATDCQGVKFRSLLHRHESEDNQLNHLDTLLKLLVDSADTSWEGLFDVINNPDQKSLGTCDGRDRLDGRKHALSAHTLSTLPDIGEEVTDDLVRSVAVTLRRETKLSSVETPWRQQWKMPSIITAKPHVLTVCPVTIGSKHLAFLVLPRDGDGNIEEVGANHSAFNVVLPQSVGNKTTNTSDLRTYHSAHAPSRPSSVPSSKTRTAFGSFSFSLSFLSSRLGSQRADSPCSDSQREEGTFSHQDPSWISPSISTRRPSPPCSSRPSTLSSFAPYKRRLHVGGSISRDQTSPDGCEGSDNIDNKLAGDTSKQAHRRTGSLGLRSAFGRMFRLPSAPDSTKESAGSQPMTLPSL